MLSIRRCTSFLCAWLVVSFLAGCGLSVSNTCSFYGTGCSNATSDGVLALSAASVTVNENAGSILLSVIRDGGSSSAISVQYATANGSATSGVDFSGSQGILSWAAGDTSARQITVPILDAKVVGGTRSFSVALSSVTGGATMGSPSSATVSINDNDTTALSAPAGTMQLTSAAITVNENAGSLQVSVTRIGGVGGAVSAQYATSNGTAVAGTDYTASSGILLWADQDGSSKTISIPITDENLTSGSKAFILTLNNPTGGASLGADASAAITIADNDTATSPPAPSGTLQFSSSTFSVNESAGTVSLRVFRSGGMAGAVAVTCTTGNGSAIAGADYGATNTALTWADGDSTTKQLNVPIYNEQLTSGTKTFTVALSAASGGASLGTPATAVVTINENDAPPQITWPTPATITYGTPLSATQLDATANAPGTFTYSPAAGTVLMAATQTLGVTFSPSSGTNSISGSVSLIVQPATPTIAWATPPPFQSGQALSSAQLDATSSVPGTFVYSPAAGTVMNAGVQTLRVLFTPTDATDYTSALTVVNLTVQGSIVANCSTAYTYSGDQNLCQVNSVAAPNAIAVRVSPSPNSANQPIVVMPADNSPVSAFLSAVTTEYFAPVSYTWSQVQPVIDSYASKATATFSSTTTSSPQVTVALPTSGIYQFQVNATDANNKTLSNYVWVNVWDSKPAIAPGNIGLNPGIAPPTSIAMLSADPGPFQHPRLLFSAGDWSALSTKANVTSGTPEALAGLAAIRTSMGKNFDQPGTTMNNLEAALLQYAADGYSNADYSAICTLIGFNPGSTNTASPPAAIVPGILSSTAMASNTDSSISDGLAAATYLAWLAVDPTQPQDPTSAGSQRLVQLGTLTAALSQFLLTTELAYPALYTGGNSGALANYDLALAYDLTYNSMTAQQQSTTRDYLYTIGNLYDTQGGGIGLYSAEPKTVPSSTSQNGVDFPNLADGIDLPALVIEGEENQLSSTVTSNPAFGTYVAAANSVDLNVTPLSSWPYANQCSVRNMERQIRANSEYILTPWGFYHTMEAYFNLGQNVSAVGTYAYSRRGENQWASTYLYQSLLQALYNLVPEQNGSGLENILDHQDGSGFAGGSGERNFYYLSKAMYPDDPMIDYVYRQATAGNGSNSLTRAIFGQLLHTSDLNTVAQAKQLGLTKFDPLVGFAISRNGWNQTDLSLEMMNYTLGNGHYHAEANSFTFTALGRVWSNPPQYHVVPGDAQQQISILTHPGAADASQGYIGQGPSSSDYLHNTSSGGPFHGVLLDVSEDPNGQWTWFAGDSKPAYDYVGGTVISADGVTIEAVETGLTNNYMLIPGLTDVLIPSDAAMLTNSVEFEKATPYNPVLYSYRSILTVRGIHPYVLVIDDMNKDGKAHDYRWSMNNSIGFGGYSGVFLNTKGSTVYASLEIEPGATSSNAILYHTVDAANTTGLPRLLVRDVSEQPATTQPTITIDDRPVPANGATSETNLTYGVDNNSHVFTYFPSRRLFIDRNDVVEPKYKILMVPYSVGDPLPTTSWNSTFTSLTVTIGSQVDTITFDDTNPDHRTRLNSFSRM